MLSSRKALASVVGSNLYLSWFHLVVFSLKLWTVDVAAPNGARFVMT